MTSPAPTPSESTLWTKQGSARNTRASSSDTGCRGARIAQSPVPRVGPWFRRSQAARPDSVQPWECCCSTGPRLRMRPGRLLSLQERFGGAWAQILKAFQNSFPIENSFSALCTNIFKYTRLSADLRVKPPHSVTLFLLFTTLQSTQSLRATGSPSHCSPDPLVQCLLHTITAIKMIMLL